MINYHIMEGELMLSVTSAPWLWTAVISKCISSSSPRADFSVTVMQPNHAVLLPAYFIQPVHLNCTSIICMSWVSCQSVQIDEIDFVRTYSLCAICTFRQWKETMELRVPDTVFACNRQNSCCCWELGKFSFFNR